ncbi:MAG: hypothetical protein JNJ88_03845 [Planctomycetes bacterium]|nr:hypothetical protein [Planctomycetota bacterium]
MEKLQELAQARLVQRRLSSVKVVLRMLHDELDLSHDQRIVMDRALVENLVSHLELFVEDTESDLGVARAPVPGGVHGANGNAERRTAIVPDKAVPRLN